MSSLSFFEKSGLKSKPREFLLIEGNGMAYRYTSAERDAFLTIGANAYNFEAYPWERSSIKRNKKSTGDLSLTVPHDNPVAALFESAIPPYNLSVTIFRENNGYHETTWVGRIIGVKFAGSKAEITCQSRSSELDRQALNDRYSYNCNHMLYGSRCGLNIDDWSKNIVVEGVSNNGTVIASTAITEADGYYVAGLASFGSQHRMITAHAAGQIELISQIQGLKPGDTIRIAKGCDRSLAACQSFNNQENYLGFVNLPDRNPFQNGLITR